MAGSTFKMAESEEFETQFLKRTSTHGKRKALSTTGNNKASKTRRWPDDEVDELIGMLEEWFCLRDISSTVEKTTTIEIEEKKELKKLRSNCK